MGRPYHIEIDALQSTYRWACDLDLGGVVRAAHCMASGPLLVIGSGGSLSAARLAATFHETATGHLARACTPLDFEGLPRLSPSTSVLILSAGGSNPDVLSAAKAARRHEPNHLCALVMRSKSRLARDFDWEEERVDLFEYPTPFGKDGYLATNSLLATAVILARGIVPHLALANDLAALFGAADFDVYREALADRATPHLARRNLLVLHDRQTTAGAYDIETRCSEAALASVQVADLRNFAHGRHQWLAKHSDTTAVVCLRTSETTALAKRTLALLPRSVPQLDLALDAAGPSAGIAAVVASILLAGAAGELHGVDPGRPHVPEFGRKLYRLRTRTASTRRDEKEVLIDRRAYRSGVSFSPRVAEKLGVAHDAFLRRLTGATFGALVLDYDGTLLGSREKSSGLRAEVRDELARLLATGLKIGIATGRGSSVKNDLRNAVDRSRWSDVVVGYYNGSQVGPLSIGDLPQRRDELAAEIDPVHELLAGQELIRQHCEVTRRDAQLTIEVSDPRALGAVRSLVMSVASTFEVRVVWSSHSVDVLSRGVSKLAVTKAVAARIPSDTAVLSIGDKGAYPGNDFELLQTLHSLSVDDESPIPDRGWRLAPPGERGVPAALRYLAALVPVDGRPGTVRFSWSGAR